MSGEDDRYWERLSGVWRAQEGAPASTALPLAPSLRWQTVVWRILFSIDALFGLFGLTAGVTMIIRSDGNERWFGVAVVAAVLSLMMTTLWAWVGPRKGDLQSAVGMIDLAISQARRQLRVAKRVHRVHCVTAATCGISDAVSDAKAVDARYTVEVLYWASGGRRVVDRFVLS